MGAADDELYRAIIEHFERFHAGTFYRTRVDRLDIQWIGRYEPEPVQSQYSYLFYWLQTHHLLLTDSMHPLRPSFLVFKCKSVKLKIMHMYILDNSNAKFKNGKLSKKLLNRVSISSIFRIRP